MFKPGDWVFIRPERNLGVVRRVGPHRLTGRLTYFVEPDGVPGQVSTREQDLWPAAETILRIATREPERLIRLDIYDRKLRLVASALPVQAPPLPASAPAELDG